MSLPSIATIRNQHGQVITTVFVNCGWFEDADSLADVFMHQVKDEGYVDTDTIEAYDVTIPVRLLRVVKDSKELAAAIRLLVATRNSR